MRRTQRITPWFCTCCSSPKNLPCSGSDTGSPASPDYGASGNSFTGAIEWVQIDLGDDDHNHLITPEQRFKIAMARQ